MTTPATIDYSRIIAAMMTTQTQHVKTDITLIGGGIAGLWMLNRFCNLGYNAILLENNALGSQQTLASQGMIHGGVKYTLSGALNPSSEAIADMPEYWARCLEGKGDVNLQQTQVLSDEFYMWSNDSVRSKVTAFLASKALRGRIEKLKRTRYPPVFQSAEFAGTVYRLVDKVLDTPSLVRNLFQNYQERVFRVDWQQDALESVDRQVRIKLNSHQRNSTIESQRIIFCAGEGNNWLMQQIHAQAPKMQVRPLKQVMVKHRHPYKLQAHCVGKDSKPRLTLSSHLTAKGETVWYLGGELAESGVGKSDEALIQTAKQELSTLFHWLDWSGAEWATLEVNRAEPLQKNSLRPDKAFVGKADSVDNVLVAWPTKLTLSPNLANEVLSTLEATGIAPAHPFNPDALGDWPRPAIAQTPWDKAFDA
ncbi:MAG: FAD-dependent oxidoreductase [Pseudomonadales bacterium]|nr:FAD-dependent oxidoreductase [Pseudomonadales bacterium]